MSTEVDAPKREKSLHKKHSHKPEVEQHQSSKLPRKITEAITEDRQPIINPPIPETIILHTKHSSKIKSHSVFDVPIQDLLSIVVLKGGLHGSKYIPMCVYELIEYIKTGIRNTSIIVSYHFSLLLLFESLLLLVLTIEGLNSNELFSNLESLKPKVDELKLIYMRGLLFIYLLFVTFIHFLLLKEQET
jgi:hypothetical protein